MLVSVLTSIDSEGKLPSAELSNGPYLPDIRLMFGVPSGRMDVYLSAQEAIDFANQILEVANKIAEESK